MPEGGTEMTLTGKVFKAYAGEIVSRHGNGSKKDRIRGMNGHAPIPHAKKG